MNYNQLHVGNTDVHAALWVVLPFAPCLLNIVIRQTAPTFISCIRLSVVTLLPTPRTKKGSQIIPQLFHQSLLLVLMAHFKAVPTLLNLSMESESLSREGTVNFLNVA